MLLRELRKSVKPLVWVIAAGFVLSLFFTYTRISSQQQGETLVKINGEGITYAEFTRAYSDAYNTYVENTGQELSPQMENYLKSQILSQLVTEELLYQEAKKAGITVSDSEVEDQVKNVMKSFGSRENFMRYLSYRRLNYSDFEQKVRRQMAASKLTRLIRNSVLLPEQQVRDYWVLRNESLDLAYLFLDPKRYVQNVKVEVEEAKKYYQQNKEQFKVPEKVKVRYILISPDEFESEVNITDNQLKDYYQEHSDEFYIEERRRASHILIEISSDATQQVKQEATEKLEQIKRKLEEGVSFAQLAQKYSDDESTAQKGGDLGYFSYEEMTEQFSKAVFSLEEVGDVSDIIQTPYGLHLVKLTGIKPAHQKSFDQVRQQLKERLLQEKKDSLARQKIQDIREKINQEELTFEEYANNYPQRANITPFFARYENVESLSWSAEFNSTAFSLEPGKPSSPVKIPEGWCIMTLEERKASHIPDWEQAKQKAIDKLEEEKAKEITAQRANSIVKQIKEEEKSLASFSDEWKYQELEDIKRQDTIKGVYGQDKDKFLKIAFSVNAGKISDPFALSDGYYIVKLNNREVPWEKFEQQKEEFRRQILATKRDQFISFWFSRIREEANIVSNASSLLASPSS